jgi:hypothetical protein
MMNSTVIPALALAASLEELASMLERVTDLEYLVPRSAGRSREQAAGGTIGAHVANCVRQVSVVLEGAGAPAFAARPAEAVATIAIEHSRRRGLSALRAVIADLEAAATGANAEPLVLQPRRDPEGVGLLRSAATGRGLALLLQQVRDHKAQVAHVLAVAACAS